MRHPCPISLKEWPELTILSDLMTCALCLIVSDRVNGDIIRRPWYSKREGGDKYDWQGVSGYCGSVQLPLLTRQGDALRTV